MQSKTRRDEVETGAALPTVGIRVPMETLGTVAESGDEPEPARAEVLYVGSDAKGPTVAKAGDTDSTGFDGFYCRELPRLVTLARGLCGSAFAEDIAQEAMLAAYRHWGELSRMEHREAWVRRVCANMAVSHFRRRAIEARAIVRLARRREPADLPPTHGEFWTRLRQLPRRQAQVAALRYVYELSVQDIAETLRCSEGTVKTHLSRARHALVNGLDLDGDEEQ
jgi:RNA polymerase sigma-70 factor, ECF subfamily